MNRLLLLLPLLAALKCGDVKTPPAQSAGLPLLEEAKFDTILDGKKVGLWTLSNRNGMTLQMTNYGARIVALWVPDKNGEMRDVVLGMDDIKSYLDTNDATLGAIVGRHAGRIGGARYPSESGWVELSENRNGFHTHGGFQGWGQKVWEAKDSVDLAGNPYITMTLLSPDGEEGYPGNLEVTVRFTLTDANELSIEMNAKTDRPTILNPTSHPLFNLHGTASKPITSHIIRINGGEYLPTDQDLIPTGEIAMLAGSPIDLRVATRIADRIDMESPAKEFHHGFDHTYILYRGTEGDGWVTLGAELYEPETGIELTVYTNRPGLQFYTGNFLDGTKVGKNGVPLGYRSGVALEAQNLPDAPNHPNFPGGTLEPGETFHYVCVYDFSVR